jgi:uncharacterized protein
MKQTFLVIYQPGTAWITGKSVSEQPLQAHSKYLLELYEANVLRFAGPFGDDSGGAAVLEVASEEEAKRIASHDPAVTQGVMVYQLYPWQLVPWEHYIRKEP